MVDKYFTNSGDKGRQGPQGQVSLGQVRPIPDPVGPCQPLSPLLVKILSTLVAFPPPGPPVDVSRIDFSPPSRFYGSWPNAEKLEVNSSHRVHAEHHLPSEKNVCISHENRFVER